jgi:hypothetical protein
MSALVNPSINGVRIVSVGNSMTHGVPLDADVLVMPDYTLVHERTGHVVRLIERGGQVLESPMNNAETNHARSLFGVET